MLDDSVPVVRTRVRRYRNPWRDWHYNYIEFYIESPLLEDIETLEGIDTGIFLPNKKAPVS